MALLQRDESGHWEGYVIAAPGQSGAPAGRVSIGTGGGRFPVWSHSGKELFYSTEDNHIGVVSYTVKDGQFVTGKPRIWSEFPTGNATGSSAFDVAADGRIITFPATEYERPKGNVHITMLFHFFDEVQRRIPQ